MKSMTTRALVLALIFGLAATAIADTIQIPVQVNPQQMGHPAYLESLYGAKEAGKILKSYNGTAGTAHVVYALPFGPSLYAWGASYANFLFFGPEQKTLPNPWGYVAVTPTAIYAPFGFGYDLYALGSYSRADAGTTVDNYVKARWDERIYGSFDNAFMQKHGVSLSAALNNVTKNGYITQDGLQKVLSQVDKVISSK